MKSLKLLLLSVIALFSTFISAPACGTTTTTVTYYTNHVESTHGVITNAANYYDGNDTTYASITAAPTETWTMWELGDQTNSAGTYLGAITKVEIRVKYDALFTGGGTGWIESWLAPYWKSNLGGTLVSLGTITNGTTGVIWSGWQDVTNDTDHPAWGLNWSEIQYMGVLIMTQIDCDAGNAYNYWYQGEVRVTYVPFLPAQVF